MIIVEWDEYQAPLDENGVPKPLRFHIKQRQTPQGEIILKTVDEQEPVKIAGLSGTTTLFMTALIGTPHPDGSVKWCETDPSNEITVEILPPPQNFRIK